MFIVDDREKYSWFGELLQESSWFQWVTIIRVACSNRKALYLSGFVGDIF
jgi:hypothetical protein